MDFSAYWKEIAVVLAAAFAIISAYFDVKDKRTGRVTPIGRIFFVLTILSMIGGFYAQWKDTAAENDRSARAQKNMLTLLRKTDRNVYDLSRLLQPIGHPSVSLFLRPDCANPELGHLCEATKKLGRDQAGTRGIPAGTRAGFVVEHVDWSDLPPRLSGAPPILVYFFKQTAAAEAFLSRACLACDDSGDLYLDLYFVTEQVNRQKPTVSAFYDTGTQEITFLVTGDSLTPHIHNDNILSIVDLPDSTMILSDPNKVLRDLTPTDIFIKTGQGRQIEASPFVPRQAGSDKVFFHHFDAQK